MQNYVKHFIDLVKEGNIDQILQERNTRGYDASQLVDEANFN